MQHFNIQEYNLDQIIVPTENLLSNNVFTKLNFCNRIYELLQTKQSLLLILTEEQKNAIAGQLIRVIDTMTVYPIRFDNIDETLIPANILKVISEHDFSSQESVDKVYLIYMFQYVSK
jgi:hypothetical protein